MILKLAPYDKKGELEMNVDMQLNEAVISEKQAETFAYNIYNEICEFIEQHPIEYNALLVNKVITEAENVIMTIDKISIRDNYKYEMCEYAE